MLNRNGLPFKLWVPVNTCHAAMYAINLCVRMLCPKCCKPQFVLSNVSSHTSCSVISKNATKMVQAKTMFTICQHVHHHLQVAWLHGKREECLLLCWSSLRCLLKLALQVKLSAYKFRCILPSALMGVQLPSPALACWCLHIDC